MFPRHQIACSRTSATLWRTSWTRWGMAPWSTTSLVLFVEAIFVRVQAASKINDHDSALLRNCTIKGRAPAARTWSTGGSCSTDNKRRIARTASMSWSIGVAGVAITCIRLGISSIVALLFDTVAAFSVIVGALYVVPFLRFIRFSSFLLFRIWWVVSWRRRRLDWWSIDFLKEAFRSVNAKVLVKVSMHWTRCHGKIQTSDVCFLPITHLFLGPTSFTCLLCLHRL